MIFIASDAPHGIHSCRVHIEYGYHTTISELDISPGRMLKVWTCPSARKVFGYEQTHVDTAYIIRNRIHICRTDHCCGGRTGHTFEWYSWHVGSRAPSQTSMDLSKRSVVQR